jgi:hemerythrin superfamily protein
LSYSAKAAMHLWCFTVLNRHLNPAKKDIGMDNIYEALRESHELQRKLCRQLVRIKPDDPRAQETFRELRIELAAHAAAEERFLYAPILLDDLGLKPSRHALAEHHEIDEYVEALGKAHKQPQAWPELARKLSREVHHHLKEEETKFFQLSGKILSDRQKSTLAAKYRRDLKRMRQIEAG